MAHVLIVDDEQKLAAIAGEVLTMDGHHVEHAFNSREAIRRVHSQDFDLVLTDLRLPDGDGLSVLKEARARSPRPEVVLMTAYGTTDNAVEAMKGGAADYLTKPFALDELRIRVRRIADANEAARMSARLVRQLTPRLVAESASMRLVLETAERAANTDQPVLITGESGTGKTQLARLIHYTSHRRAAPLIELQCTSFPPGGLEAELARVLRTEPEGPGAENGSIILDEIGELGASAQMALLNFLDAIRARKPERSQLRIIATSNRDLRALVAESRLREDLFYRLNVISIVIAPVRGRQNDILPLTAHALARHGLTEKKLSAAARERLLTYSWPGNVRELENTIDRALVLAGDGLIGAAHFDFPSTDAKNPGPQQVLVPGFNLDVFERDLVFSAIERAGGNKAAAARLLGITRRRLYSRLQSFEDRFGEPVEEDSIPPPKP